MNAAEFEARAAVLAESPRALSKHQQKALARLRHAVRKLATAETTIRNRLEALISDRAKPRSLSAELEAMRAEAPAGRCICCDGPLPKSKGQRPRVKCDELECKRLYERVYRIGRPRESRAKGGAA